MCACVLCERQLNIHFDKKYFKVIRWDLLLVSLELMEFATLSAGFNQNFNTVLIKLIRSYGPNESNTYQKAKWSFHSTQ